MLRQHSWLWLTGYAFFVSAPSSVPPIPNRLPCAFCASGPKIDASVRISSGNFPGSVRSSRSTAIPKGSNCRSSSGPRFVFPCKDNVRAKFRDHFEIRHEAAPYAWQSRHFGKLCLSGLRVLRDSDERVYSLHNPDTFDAGSGERHDSANRNGIWTLLPKESVTTVSGPCAQVAEHIAKTRTANHPRMRFNISLSVRTSVSASSSSRCIYSASNPSESVFCHCKLDEALPLHIDHQGMSAAIGGIRRAASSAAGMGFIPSGAAFALPSERTSRIGLVSGSFRSWFLMMRWLSSSPDARGVLPPVGSSSSLR